MRQLLKLLEDLDIGQEIKQMNHLKNKNIKYLIIPMIILTILTSIVITIQTYNQYKKVTVTANQKIAERTKQIGTKKQVVYRQKDKRYK